MAKAYQVRQVLKAIEKVEGRDDDDPSAEERVSLNQLIVRKLAASA